MRSAIVGCRHLHVFDLAAALAVLVFDSDVGKFNVPIHTRKLAFAGPALDFLRVALGTASGVPAASV
jgi:hypothetical protein